MSGPVPCDDGLDDILDVDADGAKDFARIVVVRDVLGHVFECESARILKSLGHPLLPK